MRRPMLKGLLVVLAVAIVAVIAWAVWSRKTRDQMQSSQIADARVRADTMVAAARQRLALWDLSADQLQALEQTRQPQAAVTFRSPAGGYVTEKQVLKGAHVTAGQSLY